MAEALVERGHEVHAVTYPLGDRSTPTPYSVHRVGWRGAHVGAAPGPSLKKMLVFDPLLIREVTRLLDDIDFDVLHAHHYEGLIAALVARRSRHRLPIVYDSHTLLATELPHYRLPVPPKLLARVGRWLDGRLPPQADHVIAVTAVMRQWFKTEGALSDDRLSLIQNGVEHEHFRVKTERERFGMTRSDTEVPRAADRPCISTTLPLTRSPRSSRLAPSRLRVVG
jgi:glycosyltransferase involved in cell wall biosynthesis